MQLNRMSKLFTQTDGRKFRYVVKAWAQIKIRLFYKNVAKKYRHTYDFDDFMRNVHDALFAIYQIEVSLPRRKAYTQSMEGLLYGKYIYG